MQRIERAALVPAGAAVLALITGGALGVLVVLQPAFLHVQMSARSLAALVAALAAGGALLWRPRAGIVLVVGLVYLNLSTLLVRFHGLPSILQALILPLLLAAWVGQGPRRFARAAMPGPLLASMVAFALVLLLSTVVALEPTLARETVLEYARALAVALLAGLLAWDRSLVHRGAWTLLVAGALLGAIGLVQAVTGSFDDQFAGLGRIKYAQVYGNVFRPRIAGPVGDPNFFAQMLVPVVALGVVMAGYDPDRRRRLIALASAGLAAAGVLLSYSRGGLLALGVILAGVVIAGALPLRRAALLALVAGAMALTQPSDVMRRLSTFREFLPGQTEELSDPDSSFAERKLLAAAAWGMFLDKPVLGVGAGNYTRHYEDYASRTGAEFRLYDDAVERHYPHNLYLEFAAETGLLGLAALGLLLAMAFGTLGRAADAARRLRDPTSRGIALGLMVGLVGYLVAAVFLHGQYPRPLWLVFGLAWALERCLRERLAEPHEGVATC